MARGEGSAADPEGAATASEPVAFSLDRDPSDRAGDRLLARLGLLDDAAPLFGTASQVPAVGALLAMPAVVDSGVLAAAREIYGSLGPAFYGLRTTLVTLLLMALLRVKRPEGLKERSPRQLGQVLGLDRAPEVKTLRRKLARLAAQGRAAAFGRALARRRVAARGYALGLLYVDGSGPGREGVPPPDPVGPLPTMAPASPAPELQNLATMRGDQEVVGVANDVDLGSRGLTGSLRSGPSNS